MMDYSFLRTNRLTFLTLVFFCSYNVMTKLLDKFSLIVEHSKTEVFHFNRLHSFFDPLSLDLSSIGDSVLVSKNS